LWSLKIISGLLIDVELCSLKIIIGLLIDVELCSLKIISGLLIHVELCSLKIMSGLLIDVELWSLKIISGLLIHVELCSLKIIIGLLIDYRKNLHMLLWKTLFLYHRYVRLLDVLEGNSWPPKWIFPMWCETSGWHLYLKGQFQCIAWIMCCPVS
jgi:hypothetical protein